MKMNQNLKEAEIAVLEQHLKDENGASVTLGTLSKFLFRSRFLRDNCTVTEFSIKNFQQDVVIGRHSSVIRITVICKEAEKENEKKYEKTLIFKRVVAELPTDEYIVMESARNRWIRNVKSYTNETIFYTTLKSGLENSPVYIPEPYYISKSNRKETSNSIAELTSCRFLMLLEDLNEEFYNAIECDIEETKKVIEAVAFLHAKYWNTFETNRNHDIWERGGYWSLDKRRAELETMIGSYSSMLMRFQDFHSIFQTSGVVSLAQRIYVLAEWISEELQCSKESIKTIIHGDIKCGNIFFPKENDCTSVTAKLAMVDWQWSGYGNGAMDVAYFLPSCVEPDLLKEKEDYFLKLYYEYLVGFKSDIKRDLTFTSFIRFYELSLVDYFRMIISCLWCNPNFKPESWSKSDFRRCLHSRNKDSMLWFVTRVEKIVTKLEMSK